MGLDPPAAGKPTSFTVLPAFRLSFIGDPYVAKFLISREWGLPFPGLCFLFPSRPRLPSGPGAIYRGDVPVNVNNVNVNSVNLTPLLTLERHFRHSSTVHSSTADTVHFNREVSPDVNPKASAGAGIEPAVLAHRRMLFTHSYSSGNVTGHRGQTHMHMIAAAPMTPGVHDKVHQPGVEPAAEVNGVLPAALEHHRMFFVINRGGPPPAGNGKEWTPSMASAPFMLMRSGNSNSVSPNAVNRDNVTNVNNVTNVDRKHVRFADADAHADMENIREQERENVSFYHVNNSRTGSGPVPGADQVVESGQFTPAKPGEIGDTAKPGKAEKIKIEQTDLDLEQFTHRVYGMLEQKIRLEKEMRGW
jgi:hypothetical protein